jgi:alpha-tubulin suppressor-like RCC1 family protein/plastocyanin
MSQTKAQLVTPLAAAGIVTAAGVVATGVVTATSFDGDVVGSATSIISGGNLNVGIISATNFSGDFTGSATGIQTGAAIKVGSFTATSFTGDFTGTATSMMRGTGFEAGAVNATGFVADVTGDVTGNATGLAGSVTSGGNIHIGVMTATSYHGDGSNLTGIAATNFNTQVVPGSTYSINVTNDGSSAYTLSGTDRNGSVSGNNASVSVEIGDTLNFVVDASGHPFYIRVSDGGANVSTPAATNQGAQSGTVSWTPNTAGTYYYQCGNHAGMIGTITVTATTTIDLSAGNCITFNQSANTTISFANTSTAMDITIIRKPSADTTISWPASISWDGGSAPTLINGNDSDDAQQFQFITRDSGVTWYAWEPYSFDGPYMGLFGWGFNDKGQLGQNNEVKYSSPTQISGTTWRSTSQGYTNNAVGTDKHVLATKTDGTLWSWGYGYNGSLGLNDGAGGGPGPKISSPVQIPGTTWGTHQTIGTKQGASLKTDGTLWVWGNNDSGFLGNNTPNSDDRSSPIQIPGTTWSWIEFGDCVMTLKTDGTLWSWGYNNRGSLGQNSRVRYSSPVQVPGTTWATSSAGVYHVAATKTDGTLWAWGDDSYGALAQDPSDVRRSSPNQIPGTTWANVKGGHQNNLATKTDGTLWGWGENNYGMLGQNSQGIPTNVSSPVQIPGTTWSTDAGDIWIGRYTALAKKTDGTLWVWGQNAYGQLGQNSVVQRSSPVQVPGTFSSFGGQGTFNMAIKSL